MLSCTLVGRNGDTCLKLAPAAQQHAGSDSQRRGAVARGTAWALYLHAMKTESAHYLREYGSLLRSLDALGFELDNYSQTPDAFGNFVADFSKGSVRFRIVRDSIPAHA